MALAQPGRNDWYRIRNQKDGPTQLHIYDEIGYFGVSASDMIRDLADVQGPLEVHLNSPGGEVFDGIAIYNSLIARKDVTIMIDGIAASIASVIAMAGNPVLIARQGQMMIHDGFGMAIGNAQDMRDFAEQLDRTSNNIAQIYAEHTGKSETYWREIMKSEAWYNAGEAIENGLADRFIDSGAGRPIVTPAKDQWDMRIYNKNRAPVRTQAWDPDGDGDDDSRPETDSDHSHWNSAGQQIKPVPGRPLDSEGRVIDIQNSAVDDSPWDAAKAMHAGTVADDPASFFKAICAGRRAGDPTSQGSYALPYRYSPSSAPNKAGVAAALGRFEQTQGLTNKEEARSKLEGLDRQINGDKKQDGHADSGWLRDEDWNAVLGAWTGGGN